MYEVLTQIGLSPDEITVYEYLLTNGPRAAGDVARHTNIKRGTAYNVLGDLVARGFAQQMSEKGPASGGVNVMKFALEHPSKIKEIIEGERNKKDEAMRSFENALPVLTSRWNLVYHRPAVTYYEGLAGLQKIYTDIINEGADILLFRSVHDDDHPELDKVVQKQIKAQVERGIKTRALTPIPEDGSLASEVTKPDEERLVTRRFMIREHFKLPAQVVVYGDKVAITDLKGAFISTLIENKNIADTFRQLFEYLWMSSFTPSDS